MFDLRKTVTLTVSRPDGAGHYDAQGRWVEGSTSNFTAEGNLQPFVEKGRVQNKLPEGFTFENAMTFYTKTEIRTANQFTDTKADTTTIDGLTFEAVSIENWNRSGLDLAHYKVIWAMRDQSTGGSL